jgi:GGDEF domain-containing protein
MTHNDLGPGASAGGLGIARATVPHSGTGAAFRVTLEPSAELVAAMKAGMTVEVPTGSAAGTPTGDTQHSTSVPAFATRSEHATHHGCPHCRADFSITCPGESSGEKRDLTVSCPSCTRPVLAPVPIGVDPGSVEIGPVWQALPPRRIRDRVRALMAQHRDLSATHAERMARLEDELAEAQAEARTDFVTGLLNERAHTDDSKGSSKESSAHGVIQVPLVESVYRWCGQASGNQVARDAAAILRDTAGSQVRAYRMGTAKFALIGPSQAVQAVLAAFSTELREATVSAPAAENGTKPSDLGIDEYLAHHPKASGLAVRIRAGQRS